MPCMCGDLQCWSCGPAQGNWKCPVCNEWADNGCDHIGEDGDLKPEFEEQVAELHRLEREAEDKMYKELEEEWKLWEQDRENRH